jgi:hypothetical protein
MENQKAHTSVQRNVLKDEANAPRDLQQLRDLKYRTEGKSATSNIRKFNVSVNDSKIKSFSSVKIQIFLFCNDFRHVFDIAIMEK